MNLYYAPGACSLADHIALHEAGLKFNATKVDLRAHRTEDGQDFYQINPKGYVPALELDGGDILTENIAILSWAAEQKPALVPPGELGRTKLLEMLAFISTEIHKSFKPYFAGGSEADKAAAGQTIGKRLGFLAERMDGDYLFGGTFTVADAYLFVMLRWAQGMGITWPEPLPAYYERVKARDAVRAALGHEGLE